MGIQFFRWQRLTKNSLKKSTRNPLEIPSPLAQSWPNLASWTHRQISRLRWIPSCPWTSHSSRRRRRRSALPILCLGRWCSIPWSEGVFGGSGGLERSGFSLQNCYRVNFPLKFVEVMNNCMPNRPVPALFFLKDKRCHVQRSVFTCCFYGGEAWD